MFSRNVVVFFGSVRDGFTSRLVKAFFGNYRGDIKYLNFYNMSISPCLDCKFCKFNNKCCILDDMQKIYYFIESHDIFIFASPVHNLTFSSPMKCFLDRTQRYFFNKISNILGKKTYLLITSGSDDDAALYLMQKQVKNFCHLIGSDFIGSIWLKNTDKAVLW